MDAYFQQRAPFVYFCSNRGTIRCTEAEFIIYQLYDAIVCSIFCTISVRGYIALLKSRKATLDEMIRKILRFRKR